MKYNCDKMKGFFEDDLKKQENNFQKNLKEIRIALNNKSWKLAKVEREK